MSKKAREERTNAVRHVAAEVFPLRCTAMTFLTVFRAEPTRQRRREWIRTLCLRHWY